MKILSSLVDLFYPKQCLGCGNHLLSGEFTICSTCRHQLPETGFCTMTDNVVTQTFRGRVPIEQGTALLFYKKEGISQKLIYHLKYKGRQDVGVFFGQWMLEECRENHRFDDIQAIIKVPLHPQKKKKRGYNQLTTFARVLSDGLSVPVVENVLVKIGKSTSQTKKTRFGRFDKIAEKFHIIDTSILTGKHVLLVDDVLTTGATLEACAMELRKTPHIKISIATMVIADNL